MVSKAFDHIPWSIIPRVRSWLETAKAAVFPTYGDSTRLEADLQELLVSAFSLFLSPTECTQRSVGIVTRFAENLPIIRAQLGEDALAALDGDPSVHLIEEVILCYPSLHALLHHRIAYLLHCESVPLIPRIIAEIAHADTGIDIHPGAAIGSRCFIDHGTGVVIGATAIIGHNVRLYQGVTLGARGFPTDPAGKIIKDQPRHPIIEDDVVIYAGATVLGRVRIGRGAVIGGNVWVTHDVAAGTRILQSPFRSDLLRGDGDGI